MTDARALVQGKGASSALQQSSSARHCSLPSRRGAKSVSCREAIINQAWDLCFFLLGKANQTGNLCRASLLSRQDDKQLHGFCAFCEGRKAFSQH